MKEIKVKKIHPKKLREYEIMEAVLKSLSYFGNTDIKDWEIETTITEREININLKRK